MSRMSTFVAFSALAALIFSLLSIFDHSTVPTNPSPSRGSEAPSLRKSTEGSCMEADGPSFWASGLAAGTDKVSKAFNTVIYKGEKFSTHTFQFAYEKYLRPRRCKRLKLLEIGLGCGFSPWKMGSSVLLWLTFLPNAEVSAFEYNEGCARTFREAFPFPLDAQKKARFKDMFVGDQSKPEDLRQVERAGPFDVIIDDGGHSMMMQITSLEQLMPSIVPGGVYILEDLETSFAAPGGWPNYLDGPNGLTTMQYLTNLIVAITHPKHLETLDTRFAGLHKLLELVKSVDCFRELCVLTRYEAGEWPVPDAPPFPEGYYPHFPPEDK